MGLKFINTELYSQSKQKFMYNLNDVVRNGLVLWLDGKDFSNSPATTSWRDRSGNGNDATPTNFAYTASSGADGVGGVMFDGVDDRFVVQHNSIFNIENKDFTWQFKFNLKNISSVNHMFLAKRLGVNADMEYIFYYNSSTKAFVFNTTQNGSVTVGNSAPFIPIINQKYTVTLMRKGNILYFYVDSVKIYEVAFTVSVHVSTNQLAIGASPLGDGTWANVVDGSIFIGLFYNRALTNTEILQNYNATK